MGLDCSSPLVFVRSIIFQWLCGLHNGAFIKGPPELIWRYSPMMYLKSTRGSHLNFLFIAMGNTPDCVLYVNWYSIFGFGASSSIFILTGQLSCQLLDEITYGLETAQIPTIFPKTTSVKMCFCWFFYFGGTLSDTHPYEICQTDQNLVDQEHISHHKQSRHTTTFLCSFMKPLNLLYKSCKSGCNLIDNLKLYDTNIWNLSIIVIDLLPVKLK